jgi:hypothetical protein
VFALHARRRRRATAAAASGRRSTPRAHTPLNTNHPQNKHKNNNQPSANTRLSLDDVELPDNHPFAVKKPVGEEACARVLFSARAVR